MRKEFVVRSRRFPSLLDLCKTKASLSLILSNLFVSPCLCGYFVVTDRVFTTKAPRHEVAGECETRWLDVDECQALS